MSAVFTVMLQGHVSYTSQVLCNRSSIFNLCMMATNISVANCEIKNAVYYIFCNKGDYIGLTKNVKRRFYGHISDIQREYWKAFGLTAHFGQFHRQDMEDAISRLEVTIVDSTQEESSLKACEDRWILRVGTISKGFNKKNEVLTNRRVQYGQS